MILFLAGVVFLLPGQTTAEVRPWVTLDTPWAVSTYDKSLIGQKHGAAWHGQTCYDSEGSAIPDRVDNETLAAAGPGTIFYCMPVQICYQGRCVEVVLVDVPKHYTLKGPNGSTYHHLDLWPAVARKLEMKGMTWGEVTVRMGEKIR